MNSVIVVGASGFGRECLDTLDAMRHAGAEVEILGVVDDAPSRVNLERLAYLDTTYLGSFVDRLASNAGWEYVLGIGNPAVRRRLATLLEKAGRSAFAAIHPTATFGTRSQVSEGVVACAGAVISTNVRIGRHVHLNPNATIGHDADLGDFVSINPGAVVSGEVVVGEGVLVGASATVLQGLRLGAGAVIGAGSVVTKNVPEGAVVKGVPGVWDAATA